MKVDTGAVVSLAPESVLANLLPSTLQPTTTVIRTYTGEIIPAKGTILVNVQYAGEQYQNLKFLFVNGSGPSLMGCDWLKIIKLDWTDKHCNADGLSLLPLNGILPNYNSPDAGIFYLSQMEALPVTTSQLKTATHTDPILSKVIPYLRGTWPANLTITSYLHPFSNRQNELTVSYLRNQSRFPQTITTQTSSRITSRPPWSFQDEVCPRELHVVARSG